MNPPLLAAALIVKDEADLLPACLDSLAGVVDEVHVHDTGSVDGTPDIAARYGAVVTHGAWAGDFAAARNAAQAGWTARWVLAVDADHRITADPAALRAELVRATAEVLLTEIHNAHDTRPYVHHEARLYRPDVVGWTGKVHERLVRPGGSRPATGQVPAGLLTIDHIGYAAREARIAKAVRNAELARRTLDELGDDAEPAVLARALLDLGRSYVGAERGTDAVTVFEAVRARFPRTPEWTQATDFLARQFLAAGRDEACLALVGELRAAGAGGAYCDWIAAQAHAQLGRVRTAADLLDGVTEVVDTAGRRHDPRALDELRGLMRRLVRLDPSQPVSS